jgi:hypothetical protein
VITGLSPLPPRFTGKPAFYSPTGWEEIVDFYQWDPKVYLGADGRVKESWRKDHMVLLSLPEPMALSWQPDVLVKRVTVHRAASLAFGAFYVQVHDAGLWPVLRLFGGIYEFRRIAGSPKLSLHSLAAAADHDPRRNARGVEPKLTTIGGTSAGHEVIQIAEQVGLTCGVRFKAIPDAQHFQLARGY